LRNKENSLAVQYQRGFHKEDPPYVLKKIFAEALQWSVVAIRVTAEDAAKTDWICMGAGQRIPETRSGMAGKYAAGSEESV
jgi:hypothetical protein